MQIDKNSWHYKFYRFTYFVWGYEPPYQHTSLCQYVSRMIWSPLIDLALLPIVFVIWLLITMFNLCIGFRPTIFWRGSPPPWVPYEGWKLGPLELYPAHILPVVILGLIEHLFIHHYGWAKIVVVQASILGIIILIVAGAAI